MHYKMGNYAPTTLQIDNDALLPYYSWLAKQFTYCDYHFGLGTNSTPGHMLAVGKELADPKCRKNIHTSTQPSDDKFTAMAVAKTLPDFSFVWSPSGYDEHAPDQTANPQFVTKGQNLTWQRVDSVVKAGDWANTAFILTWDDWGGYTYHVSTRNAETVIDALHPACFQLIGGTRIPMLMFCGQVKEGIDTNWHPLR